MFSLFLFVGSKDQFGTKPVQGARHSVRQSGQGLVEAEKPDAHPSVAGGTVAFPGQPYSLLWLTL